MFHRIGREGLYTFVATLALCLIAIVHFGRASNISNGCTTGPPVITRLSNTCVGDQNMVLSGSVSCTWSANPPAGSSLVCGGATYNGGGTVPTGLSISDGTTFTNALAPRLNGATMRWSVVSYRFNIAVTAPATITMTLTGGNDQFANLVCNAFTDTGTPTPDGTCTFDGTTGTTTSCSSAITTTGLDYVIGLTGASGTFPTAGAGWTIGANVKGTVTETQIQTAPGSINPLFNTQTGQTGTVTGFAIKP